MGGHPELVGPPFDEKALTPLDPQTAADLGLGAPEPVGVPSAVDVAEGAFAERERIRREHDVQEAIERGDLRLVDDELEVTEQGTLRVENRILKNAIQEAIDGRRQGKSFLRTVLELERILMEVNP